MMAALARQIDSLVKESEVTVSGYGYSTSEG